jgi:hypothetical protein
LLFAWFSSAALAAEDAPVGFPDAPAVVLREETDFEVHPRRGRARLLFERETLVRDGAALPPSARTVYYNATSYELTEFAARVIDPSGEVVSIGRRQLVEARSVPTGCGELRALELPLSGLAEGSRLEWEYELTSRRMHVPSALWWEVQGDLPVIESRLATRILHRYGSTAYRLRLMTRREDLVDRHCEVSGWGGGPSELLQRVECRNVPAQGDEPMSPPDNDVRLRVLTAIVGRKAAGSWREMREDLLRRARRVLSDADRAASLAPQIAPETLPEAERLDRLHAFVRENVTVEPAAMPCLLEGSARPCRRADEVLEARAGTAAEVALLEVALLRGAGFRAWPVLAVDRSIQSFARSVPDPCNFSQLLVLVRTGEGAIYLDAACRACPFGVPDWRFSGRGSGGLILDEKAPAEPIAFSAIGDDQNWEIRKETVVLQPDGSGFVEGEATWRGLPEVEMRRRWFHLPEAARAVNFLLRIGGGLEDTSVTSTDPGDFTQNLRASYRFRQSDLARKDDAGLTIGPPAGMEKELGIPLADERVDPIWSPFTRTIVLARTYSLPEGFDAGELPGRLLLKGPSLRFEGGWSRSEAEGDLVFRAKLRVADTLIPVEDYPRVRDFLTRMMDYLDRRVTLQRRVTDTAP